MATIACRTCGRVVDIAEPGETLAPEHLRCPRCGAYLTGKATGTEPAPAGDPRAPQGPRAAAVARLPSRIAFLGFGLIGGSIALALREAGSSAGLVAWTPNGKGPSEGRHRSILDEAAGTAATALDGAGLVILAGPALSVVSILDDLAGPLRPALSDDATITDVASTKRLVMDAAAAGRLPFVGGHPMAGREATGVASATADLFVDRPWVIVPADRARPVDLERVEALVTAVGARPVQLDAEQHDAAVAAISHLPLVLAAALAESIAASPDGTATWPTARILAATGWSDMTRLARGDPEMGAGILATNAAPVAERLRAVRRAIDAWIQLLDGGVGGGGPDPGVIRDQLAAARSALERDPEP